MSIRKLFNTLIANANSMQPTEFSLPADYFENRDVRPAESGKPSNFDYIRVPIWFSWAKLEIRGSMICTWEPRAEISPRLSSEKSLCTMADDSDWLPFSFRIHLCRGHRGRGRSWRKQWQRYCQNASTQVFLLQEVSVCSFDWCSFENGTIRIESKFKRLTVLPQQYKPLTEMYTYRHAEKLSLISCWSNWSRTKSFCIL